MTERYLQLMGTIIHLKILQSEGDPQHEIEWASQQLRKFNHTFSANDDGSVLMQVNHAAGKKAVTVPRKLFWLIEVGKRYSLFDQSNLDIAIGPLVKLWHIGFIDARRPSDEQIREKLALTHPEDIHLDVDHSRVFLGKRGMEIDLGALAKGYFADLIAKGWRHDGVISGMINLGGNVVVIGNNPHHENYYWTIGLQDPTKPLGQCIRNINLRDRSVVTSGINQRNFTDNQHFYHHLLNPRTGYPFDTDLASLSIISRDSLTGELWTSILFGHSWKYIDQVVRQTAGIQAIGIRRDGQMLNLFD